MTRSICRWGPMPTVPMHHCFAEISSLQSTIYLEVLQLYFWETRAFFTMPSSIGNCIHLWFFFGKELVHYKPQYSLKFADFCLRNSLHYKIQYSLKCCSILFEKYMPFSKWPLQLETAFTFDFFGKELLNNKTQYPSKCCSIPFGSFEKYTPFSRCLLHLGNALK